ncbi:MAG: acetoacetate metabolism regulatory protein AtoC [Nitrospirales bacterium]|nr:MAG: acetoacetate metabolism regulatory protein AtoC [Nitrospirales bacterium]
MLFPLSEYQVPTKPRVFILEPNKQLHRHLKEESQRYHMTISNNLHQAIRSGALHNGNQPDLVVIDVSHTRAQHGLTLGKEFRQYDQTIPLLLITRESSEDMALAALRTGINDYVKEPFTHEEFSERVSHWITQGSIQYLTRKHKNSQDCDSLTESLVGTSSFIQDIRADMTKMAWTQSNVLITGETGTGKEVVAQAIHRISDRRDKSFICVNCAAIPETLLESELFGHEQGAFTGARYRHQGKLEQAQGGTILFDEIGDMELSAQAKILRAIEERQVQRLGGHANHPLNIRVIAATNQDLEQAVKFKQFRSDLFYRLNVARIHLPPLRERKEDIPLLIQHFIREFNPKFHREVKSVSAEALDSLLRYSWPGNVRELRNLIEASFIHLPDPSVRYMDLPLQFRAKTRECATLPQNERDQILAALLSTKWSRTKAAQKLQWSRMTLYRKMAKHNISQRGHKMLHTHSEYAHPINEPCTIS